jgi:hypothetical protein
MMARTIWRERKVTNVIARKTEVLIVFGYHCGVPSRAAILGCSSMALLTAKTAAVPMHITHDFCSVTLETLSAHKMFYWRMAPCGEADAMEVRGERKHLFG